MESVEMEGAGTAEQKNLPRDSSLFLVIIGNTAQQEQKYHPMVFETVY